jgi:hypothetical protein
VLYSQQDGESDCEQVAGYAEVTLFRSRLRGSVEYPRLRGDRVAAIKASERLPQLLLLAIDFRES